jgi:cyclic 2,3-diphosphoglycerate synthase
MQGMSEGPVIALIDGEHHPEPVRDALARLDRERGVAGTVFCGGEEKVKPEVLQAAEEHYGRPVLVGERPGEAIRRLATDGASGVVDLSDEPVLRAAERLRLAALALHLGLEYEAPGMRLSPPPYAAIDFAGPKLAVIATGKRTGKTAVAGHWAALLRQSGVPPVIVAMGRGGPPEPVLAEAGISLDDLLEIAAAGRHAASDYLEDAVLAGVPAVGCRRVGGGLAGEPFESNVPAGAALAASLEPGAIILEGSGGCIPPVEADRTVCIVGERGDALGELGTYRLLRADLALVSEACEPGLVDEVAAFVRGDAIRFGLRAEPAGELPPGARVALFSTGPAACDGVEPVVKSSNLARRSLLADDLARAAAEGCDLYLTELKAAAIDTVARQARETGAGVAFLRNRPVGVDGDLDQALLRLHSDV